MRGIGDCVFGGSGGAGVGLSPGSGPAGGLFVEGSLSSAGSSGAGAAGGGGGAAFGSFGGAAGNGCRPCKF